MLAFHFIKQRQSLLALLDLAVTLDLAALPFLGSTLGLLTISAAHIGAGAAVGFAIGVTGVGGGSLMTPILLLLGYAPAIAIGTDLLYAALTKAGGVLAHSRQKTIDWGIVALLSAGSLPAAIATHIALASHWLGESEFRDALLTQSLGAMLLVTALLLALRSRLKQRALATRKQGETGLLIARRKLVTIAMGLLLGVCVTLSSVGAGAFAAAILMTLYTSSPSSQIVGTDIAHAVPLTLLAGIGYMLAGSVDYALLLGLLAGSLPAIQLGSRVGHRINEKHLRWVLTALLAGLGVSYLAGALP